MIKLMDEGYTDEEETVVPAAVDEGDWHHVFNTKQREELVYQLLSSMPRSQIAKVHRRIAPFLQFDIVGALPSELSLLIFAYLPYQTLLKCALVSKTWRKLSDDPALWKTLCHFRRWEWKNPTIIRDLFPLFPEPPEAFHDEGMGDDEDDDDSKAFLEQDSGIASQIIEYTPAEVIGLPSTPRRNRRYPSTPRQQRRLPSPAHPRTPTRHIALLSNRHSAPSILPSLEPLKPDYKLLHQTHVLLHNRLLHSSYRLSTLQTRGTPNSHTSTIYCLQLYTYAEGARQVLFTGSKDRTIREWDLTTGAVDRVFDGVHTGSVLSLCVSGNYLASAGSDWLVCVWDLRDGTLVKTINDHHESVLCVRFDDKRLVSCSKDRTIRTYLFPDLAPHRVLSAHRAAVNAVAIMGDQIVSASGDKSMRLWDANTGASLQIFEGHHTRGIAAIDFQPPFILSGSSDRHIRLFDVSNHRGWSTCTEFHNPPGSATASMCEVCGGSVDSGELNTRHAPLRRRASTVQHANAQAHGDLVRSVALGPELVLSGSYDQSVKVWDRKTGALVADLSGGHEGRIFCVGFDCTKIVSCGEDQKICIWDFSFGIDTSFITL